MTTAFISYSRKDHEFARTMVNGLSARQIDTWIDWEDIPPSTDWWLEIIKGIEESDAVLFILSPDSAASKVCVRELTHAIKVGKRIIPVVIKDVKAGDVLPEIAKVNWIFARKQDSIDEAFQKIDTAIHVDFIWVQKHRELLAKSLKWERRGRESSYLLRGKELVEVEKLLANSADNEPALIELQKQYVQKSRDAIVRQKRLLVFFFLLLLSFVVGQFVWADRSWYRVWPIRKACPKISTVSVVFIPGNLPLEIYDEISSSINQEVLTDLSYCRSNEDSTKGILAVRAEYRPETNNLLLEVVLPSIPAYTLDFLPEVRKFQPEMVSVSEAIALIKALSEYSVGNYEKATTHIKPADSGLAEKIIVAQSYLFMDQIILSRDAYGQALKSTPSPNAQRQLRMGVALTYWRQQINDQVRSNPDLASQNQADCDNAIFEYQKVVEGNDIEDNWVLLSSISKYYCWHPDWMELKPIMDVSGNPYQDFLSAMLLVRSESPSQHQAVIEKLLLSAAKEIALSNLELSKYFADYLEDCRGYQKYMTVFQESAVTRLDFSLVRYYYRTETCWP